MIVSDNGAESPVASVEIDAEKEKAIFKLATTLQPGTAHLKLAFKGTIIDKLKGFYCSKYTRYVFLVEFSNPFNPNVSLLSF